MRLARRSLHFVAVASLFAGLPAIAAEDCPFAKASSMPVASQVRDLVEISDRAGDKSSSCDAFFAANPEAKEFAATKPNSLSDAIKAAAENAAPQLSCLKGLVTNWKDQATDIYDFIKNAGAERKAFIKSCEEDDTGECRRQLTERARGPAPEKESVTALLERAEKREEALKQIKKQQANSKAEGMNLGPVLAAAWDKLKKTGVEIQCYKPAKQTELLCYGIGYVLDPSILIPGGKAVTSAARIRSLAKLTELKVVAEAETVATKTALEQSAEKLGFTPSISMFSNPQGKGYLTVIDPQTRRTMGFTKYDTPRDHVLDPGELNVFPDYQNKGVYKAMLEHQLKEHPETTQIHGSLWHDNQRAVETALQNGATCLEAIMASPAYKVRAGLGFSKVVSYSCDGHPTFVVERP